MLWNRSRRYIPLAPRLPLLVVLVPHILRFAPPRVLNRLFGLHSRPSLLPVSFILPSMPSIHFPLLPALRSPQHITNNLLKHIDQLRADKIRIEHELEAESEAVMNRLARELSTLRNRLEAAGLNATVEGSNLGNQSPRSPSRSPSRASSLSRRSLSGANSPRLGSPLFLCSFVYSVLEFLDRYVGQGSVLVYLSCSLVYLSCIDHVNQDFIFPIPSFLSLLTNFLHIFLFHTLTNRLNPAHGSSSPAITPLISPGPRRDSLEMRGRANSSLNGENPYTQGLDRVLDSLQKENHDLKKSNKELDDRCKWPSANLRSLYSSFFMSSDGINDVAFQ